ncbi:uncharacterized protein BDZ99DRAFT_65281 [Mytilinidion resinicola]|uniref:Hepatocellular carcinoma-associated antigen 59 n=1 Tax=Mytilinidion resinicola TaxID=574789 RepID=A0A6A6YID3_9PEZI|nr:uncharacterized protein BDZ99DRAFT_65281 [Mytilinidion resinicola]KAF2807754.1 hypothetical protein BDZ99DRAFT_65281 [Mytilinidion resinicola]
MADLDAKPSEPLFRASKRRKIFRKAVEDESHEITSPQSLATPESHTRTPQDNAETEGQKDGGLSMAEILRRRKQGKTRRAGIEFSNSSQTSTRAAAPPPSDALIPHTDDNRSAVDIAAKRFAPQTGKVADVHDKHMMEFIDARMAELRHSQAALSITTLDDMSTEERATAIAASEKARERQPAGVGKLQEIDLGPDATAQNIARTEAARRKMEGLPDDEPQSGLRPGKVRLGRDGKPWRGRKRRNSEDIKRDLLVEEVLRESRLDMYDEPEALGHSEGDQAADDLLAERFRQEFIDAVESRNVRRTAPAPPGAAKGTKGEERPKGPKLGGSRSARAAMRAIEEKAAKKR